MRAVLHSSPRRIGQNGFELMLEGDLVPHLKYPWQHVVLDAFINLLPRKLKAAERVICARLHDSRTTDFDEQFALQDALGSLRILLPPRKQARWQIGRKKSPDTTTAQRPLDAWFSCCPESTTQKCVQNGERRVASTISTGWQECSSVPRLGTVSSSKKKGPCARISTFSGLG